jgi:hypothetical protein
MSTFLQIWGILKNVLKRSLIQGQSELKVYNVLAVPSLLYGCNMWTLKQRDMRILNTAEMKFMTLTAGYSLLDHRRNEDILEIKADPVKCKSAQYKQKRLDHVSKMEDIRYPEKLLDYRPIKRRRPGRPLKRLLDG